MAGSFIVHMMVVELSQTVAELRSTCLVLYFIDSMYVCTYVVIYMYVYPL